MIYRLGDYVQTVRRVSGPKVIKRGTRGEIVLLNVETGFVHVQSADGTFQAHESDLTRLLRRSEIAG